MKTHPSDTRPIRDFVIPICELVPTQDGKSLNKEESKLCGTCFLIGDQGFAITAAHVVEQSTDEFRFGMVAVGDEERTDFYKIKVLKHEKHPTEDVSIIKFEMFPDGKRISYFKINLEKQFSALDYHMWSYPIAVAEEVKYHNIPSDFLDFRPDLTVFKGYIRRRMPFSPNPSYSSYRGKIFYELSEIAGECSSGAPIFINRAPIWDVFAIYVGDAHGRKGGYGLSLESIGEWVPEMLGCTIAEEAKRPVSEL